MELELCVVAGKPAVLFRCLGNICPRSPLAEAALKAERRGIGLDVDVDSAGIGDYGIPANRRNPRAQAVAKRDGIDISF